MESGSLDSADLQALLELLPLGLALVDRDGRFLTMNHAFRTAAGIKGGEMPSYPGDLVVKEDKARGRRCGAPQRPRARRCRATSRFGSTPAIGRAGGADRRRPARAGRCGGAAAAQGQ